MTNDAAVPAPIDPEHDIDAKTTVIWLSACLLLVVVMLIVLGQWFAFTVQRQQYEKINAIPTVELKSIRSDEDHYLRKVAPVGDAETRNLDEIQQSIRSSTDGIIDAYVNK